MNPSGTMRTLSARPGSPITLKIGVALVIGVLGLCSFTTLNKRSAPTNGLIWWLSAKINHGSDFANLREGSSSLEEVAPAAPHTYVPAATSFTLSRVFPDHFISDSLYVSYYVPEDVPVQADILAGTPEQVSRPDAGISTDRMVEEARNHPQFNKLVKDARGSGLTREALTAMLGSY